MPVTHKIRVQFPVAPLTLYVSLVHLLFVTMLSAIEQIKSDYDYEDAKQIVTSGCQSGVCFKHIYYADTVEFFNKYPDEITEYIVDTSGIDFMKSVFDFHNGWLDGYMNDLTWAFIESVCIEIVDEYESTTCEELSNANRYLQVVGL